MTVTLTTATRNLATAVKGAGRAANKLAHRDDELILAIVASVEGKTAQLDTYLDTHATLTVDGMPVESPYSAASLKSRFAMGRGIVARVGLGQAEHIVGETDLMGEHITLRAIYAGDAAYRKGLKAAEQSDQSEDQSADGKSPATVTPDVDKIIAGLLRAAEKLSDTVRGDLTLTLSDDNLTALTRINHAMVNATRISAGRKVKATA